MIAKEWPRLEATTRIGKTKYWIIRVLEDNGIWFIETEYWQDEGAHQTATRKVEGKNIGRSNETMPRQQALLEAESDFKKQKDKGYCEEGEDTEDPYFLPMLAHDFKKRGHNINWPCFGQPKLDGFRCLFHPKLGFWSRQGKPFGEVVDLKHLHPVNLNWDKRALALDGELILPKGYTFQQTCSAIKKQCELTPLLEYHIFDVVIPDLIYRSRMLWLNIQEEYFPEKVRVVHTKFLKDLDVAKELFATYIEEGNEGLMLRNENGLYTIGQRTPDLQKYKEFEDAEYLVVDIVEGVGREEGAAILICETKDKQTFKVRPKGDYDSRRAMFKSRDVLGKYFTVRYQNLSDTGIPRFPVGIAVREDWDR